MPADGIPAEADLPRLRSARLARLQQVMQAEAVDACLLYDPINIRYASDSRNMAVWTAHNPVRFLVVPAEGGCILFEFHGSAHLSRGLETIAEVRPAIAWDWFSAGPRRKEMLARWVRDVDDVLRGLPGGSRRIGFDLLDPALAHALAGRGWHLLDGRRLVETARMIKSPDEIACLRRAVAVAADGIAAMRAALRPGITENALWAELHRCNIAAGGEWIETRLLSSGPRTNPWFQECGDRVIEAGDLVCFDTDMIGPGGYCADISRAMLAGDRPASNSQRTLHALAREQIEHNMGLLRPGLAFAEFAERSWPLPARYRANRYSCLLHGVGLCDEYPLVVCREDYAGYGYDGILEAGMTLCVESYLGEEGGQEGIKLEQQVLVTESGIELLSQAPFDERLDG